MTKLLDSTSGGETRIHGFFVQPWLGYGATNETKFSSQGEYDQWVQSMGDVGAEMLFYQWSVHYEQNKTWFSDAHGGSPDADFAFYNPPPSTLNGIPTRGWSSPSTSTWPGTPSQGGKEPLAYLLDAAQKAGIKVWLGLYLNEVDGFPYNWWDAIKGEDFDNADKNAIQHHVDRSVAVVNDLASQFGTHPALGGIYYSVEVTNQQAFIKNHAYLADEIINPVAKAVHAKLPGKKLALSPFFNTGSSFGSPEQFGKMWAYVLENSELDILILQDGVGVEPETLNPPKDKITAFFNAVKDAADAAGKPLWGNAELFTNKGTRKNPEFVSSTLDKIRLQLDTEVEHVEKFVCSDFHYMDPNPNYTFFKPLGGTAQKDREMREALYNSYKKYYDSL